MDTLREKKRGGNCETCAYGMHTFCREKEDQCGYARLGWVQQTKLQPKVESPRETLDLDPQ